MAVKDYRKHILNYYNHFAWFYDRMEFFRAGTRRRVVEMSRAAPGDRVLDVCAGTGELALAFKQCGALVTAIDLARGMLLRGINKSRHMTGWVQMDALRLSFPDKIFDISSISLALHHMPEKTQVEVLRELGRVTRRRIVLVEPNVPGGVMKRNIWASIFDVLDESEYIWNWSCQDLGATCLTAGLTVDEAVVTSLGLHLILNCRPEIQDYRI